mmetsp:Transcript_119225/g.380057  ORF Transcript_119225/g.380057 Transcript_119225/m.380057 type:complete len:668 (-) Transcript_119225:178-2181(-)
MMTNALSEGPFALLAWGWLLVWCCCCCKRCLGHQDAQAAVCEEPGCARVGQPAGVSWEPLLLDGLHGSDDASQSLALLQQRRVARAQGGRAAAGELAPRGGGDASAGAREGARSEGAAAAAGAAAADVRWRAPPSPLATSPLEELRNWNEVRSWAHAWATQASEVEREAAPGRNCSATGARMWLSQKGLDYFADGVPPAIVQGIKDMEFPGLEGVDGGFKWQLRNIKMLNFSMPKPLLEFSAERGIYAHTEGIKFEVSADYDVRGASWWNPLYSAGSVLARFRNSSTIAGYVSVGVKPDGFPRVGFKFKTLQMDLLDVSISGSFVSSLLNLITYIFQSRLEEEIEETMRGTANLYVKDTVNKFLKDSLPLITPLGLDPPYNTTVKDFTLCGVTISNESMAVSLRGGIYDIAVPDVADPEPSIAEPLRALGWAPQASTTSMLAVSMQDRVFNDAMFFVHRSGTLRTVIWKSPPDSQVALTTALLSRIYPPSFRERFRLRRPRPLSLWLQALDAPTLGLSKEGVIQATATVALTLKVEKVPWIKQAALSLEAAFTANLGVGIKDGDPQKIQLKLKDIHATSVKVVRTLTPDYSFNGVIALLDLILSGVVTPVLRDSLSKGYLLDAVGGFMPLNTSVAVGGGDLEVGTDIAFNAEGADDDAANAAKATGP